MTVYCICADCSPALHDKTAETFLPPINGEWCNNLYERQQRRRARQKTNAYFDDPKRKRSLSEITRDAEANASAARYSFTER